MSRIVKRWTPEQDAILHRMFSTESVGVIAKAVGRTQSAVYSRAILLGLKRPPEVYERLKAERRMRAKPKPELKVQIDDQGRRRMHHWLPVGTERPGKWGYLHRKVSETGVKEVDWIKVSHLVWIEHHGPIPPRHQVAFKDGDKLNTDISNLFLRSFAEAVCANSICRYPREYRRTAIVIGQFKAKLKKLEATNENTR